MPAPQVSAANFTSATNTGLAMQNAVNNGQPVNPNNQPNVNTNPTATNAYTGQTFSTLPSTNNSSPATTTPIVSANAATQDYLTKKAATDQIAQGVAQQAKNNAQNQVNTATNTTSGIFASQGGNQPTTGQNTNTSQNSNQNGTVTAQSDNSDLTSALSDATAALNAGNGIQAPDQNAENQTQAGYQQQEQDVQNQLSNINDQIQSAVTNYQSSLNQIQNGTFPLTPAQQGLLQQTQSAVASLTQSAQQTAQLYAQGAQTFGAVHGLAEFNPGAAMQAVTAAAAKGAAAVAQAELDGAKQLAALQQSFQTDDMDLMTKSYDALQTSLDSKQKTLESMASEINTAAKNAQDEYNTQVTQYNTETQNAISNAFKAITLNDSQKKDLFDEAMQSATFSEKQKQDMTDDYYKGIAASQNATKIQQGQEDIDLKVQALQQSQDTAAQAAGNAVITLPNKAQYIDGTNLDAAGKAAALNSGVPVLSGDNAKSMTTINNIQTQFGGLLSSLQQAGVLNDKGQFTITNNPSTGITNKGGTIGFLHYWAGGSAEPSIVNFGTNVKSMITDLQKLPGTGDLVQSLEDNTPLKTDNAQQLQTKFSNLTNDLLSSQNDLLGGGLDTTTQEGATGVINGKTYIFTNGNWVSQ